MLMLHRKTGYVLLLLMVGLRAAAQYERPENSFSVGYQYANFGNSLSSSQIRMAGMNTNVGPGGNRFTNSRNAYGLVLRAMVGGDGRLISEFALGNKKVIADQAYTQFSPDSLSSQELNIKTKQRMRYFTYGLHYNLNRFTVGASVDLGMFTSLIRYKGIGGESDGKWLPWFSTPKVFGSGYTGKTPVIGCTLSAAFALTSFTEIRIFKQFTAFGMGADLSDRYFSMSNWGVELAITFGK